MIKKKNKNKQPSVIHYTIAISKHKSPPVKLPVHGLKDFPLK